LVAVHLKPFNTELQTICVSSLNHICQILIIVIHHTSFSFITLFVKKIDRVICIFKQIFSYNN